MSTKTTGRYVFVWRIEGGNALAKTATLRNRADTEEESRQNIAWWTKKLEGKAVLVKRV